MKAHHFREKRFYREKQRKLLKIESDGRSLMFKTYGSKCDNGHYCKTGYLLKKKQLMAFITML